MTDSKPHSTSEWPDKPLTAHRVYQLARGRQEDERSVIDLMASLRNLEEQFEARERLVNEVRFYFEQLRTEGVALTIGMEQALDALDASNPASGAGTSSAEGMHEANAAGPRESSPASEPEATDA